MRYLSFILISTFVGLCLTGCTSATASRPDAAFEYREIYMPETIGKNALDYGLNSVDYDWGLWGHNLDEVLPKTPSLTVYAKSANGTTNKEQFCFSSSQLYKYIEEFITENYGDDEESVRFAIVPNDNMTVCLCQKCVALGNSADDASPAVFDMIVRLARRFPNHSFFTADYNTTSSFPKRALPENVGILVSAIKFPRYSQPSEVETEFVARIGEWNKYLNNIYVWDYINNFDDYFTPVPLFSTMQHRLRAYRDAGVKGIFLNGSGRDYTSLGKLNALVLDRLTADPDTDWKTVLRELCTEHYPVAGDAIYDFMIAQDDYVRSTGKYVPLYEGIHYATKSYLPVKEFIRFYDNLVELRDKAEGAEKDELEVLVDALSLTRLEIMRHSGDIKGYQEPLRRLSRLASERNIDAYNESGWSVYDYIKDFRFIATHADEMQGKNLLRGMKVFNRSPLDEDYTDLSILTDGMLGMPSNYHNGNLISSANPSLTLEVPYVEGARNLRVALVSNPGYHIGLPVMVNLSYEGHKIKSVEPALLKEHMGHSFVEFEIPQYVKGPLTVAVFRDPESRTMAIDEIELY